MGPLLSRLCAGCGAWAIAPLRHSGVTPLSRLCAGCGARANAESSSECNANKGAAVDRQSGCVQAMTCGGG